MATRNRAQSTEDKTAESTEDITVTPAEQQTVVPVSGRPNYDDNTLHAIANFKDAIDAAGYMFGDIADASEELGNGFVLLDKADRKSELIGKPMILLGWQFHQSLEFGGEFVSILAVTDNGDGTIGKYIINDGSTGIYRSLSDYTRRTGRQGGLGVKRGFRESQYNYCNDCRIAVKPDHKEVEPTHQVGIARTYYLDASK